jgi:hypothetical protein
MTNASDKIQLTQPEQRSQVNGSADPFKVPFPKIEGGLYRMAMNRETFEEEERAQWDEYVQQTEEARKDRERLGLVDFGELWDRDPRS